MGFLIYEVLASSGTPEFIRATVLNILEDYLAHLFERDRHILGKRGIWVFACRNLGSAAVVFFPGTFQAGLRREIEAQGPPLAFPVNPRPLMVGGFSLSVHIPVDAGFHLYVPALYFRFRDTGRFDCCLCDCAHNAF
jgi:hypothetical protein